MSPAWFLMFFVMLPAAMFVALWAYNETRR
jgi:hypothetical protein